MSELRRTVRPRNLAALRSLFAFIAFALPAVCLSQNFRLGWDPSPTPGVTNYILYGDTNALSWATLANAHMKLNTGTNTGVTIDSIPVGRYYFTVTAIEGGMQSTNSNIIMVDVPAPPTNLLTVVLQWGATVGSVTNDALFLKLRIP